MKINKVRRAPQVPLELWRELYQAAKEFQLLAPWRWMDNIHALGIDNEHGQRLLSVMGALGEVFGLVSYRGPAGITFSLRLLRGEVGPGNPDALFYQDAVLVDFVPRRELRKEDQALLRAVGFQPVASRPRRFPKFSSHLPGYFPWFLNETEARQALDDLRKTTRFAQLLLTAPEGLVAPEPETFPFFPNTVSEPLSLEQFQWRKLQPLSLPADPSVSPQRPEFASLAQGPQRPGSTWELMAFYSPTAVNEGDRPFWPKLGVVVDAASQNILGFHMSGPDATMAETAALALAQSIQAVGSRPALVQLDSLNVHQALGPLAQVLGTKLVAVRSLASAPALRQSMEMMAKAF